MGNRGNSKKRKVMFICISFFVIICIVAIALLTFKVDNIKVVGNNYYKSEEIISKIFIDKKSYSMPYAYYKEKTKPHVVIPFVEDYKLVFKGINEVEIIVYEKSIIGCIEYMGYYMYFDKDGVVAESSLERLAGVPLVNGIYFDEISLHRKIPVKNEDIFSEILSIKQMLDSNEIIVDEIYFDKNLYVSLYIGELEVELGNSKNRAQKIMELKNLLAGLEGLKGKLDISVLKENGNYSFIKK
jgi:hypothetical protein